MLASDDPRGYRHATNAHSGQPNSPLDVPAEKWLKARVRIERGALRTIVYPEVLVETGPKAADPSTGVPRGTGETSWVRLSDKRTRRPLQVAVLSCLPGGKGRIERSVRVWNALFRARAFIPSAVEDAPVSHRS